jgi:hypothetical protein
MTRISLTVSQIAVSALLGAVLWFVAAVFLATVGPTGVFEGVNRVMLYAAVIPGTIPSVLLIWKVARLGRDQIAMGMAVATTMAMLLDGVALAWFPGLYGGGVAQTAASGAVILWGAAIGQLLGFAMNRAS